MNTNKRFTISIRTILVAGFGGLTAGSIVVALVIGLGTAFHNTQDLLAEKADEIVSRIASEIDHQLQPAESLARRVAAQAGQDSLPFRRFDEDRLSFYFNAALAATPQIVAAAFFDTDGIMHQWLRTGGRIDSEDWSGRQQVMKWIANGATRPPSVWGPPIWLESAGTAVIVHETPLFDSEGYLGYLALAVPITKLSTRLSGIAENSFVLVNRNEVLAHPMMINWHPEIPPGAKENETFYSGRASLMSLEKLGDPVLERIWSAEEQDPVLLRKMTRSQASATNIDGRPYVFLFRPVQGYGPKPWVVGTYIDAERSVSVVKRMGSAAWIGLALLAISIVASLLMARALTRPIRALATASEAVRNERFDQVTELPISHVKELNGAMSSFEGMIAGLAERDLIRSTLGRYVPSQVAELLLSDSGGLSPVEAEATVLFCDVVGFTSLTEALGPTRIVDVLNAYFSRMTGIIEAHGGVITQFQGDAILAIFNIPIEADDHAEQACRTAIAMRESVLKETFSGQALRNRVGINTGPVVAGAVGAEGRLTYTVHGDAVNRAARIESLNKDLGTSILLSTSTQMLLNDLSPRKVGDSVVRGQKGDVVLYTLDE